jgi:protein-disulfide isomerase
MHDLLFTHQTQLDRPSLEGYAQQLKLDMAKFKADMDQSAYARSIALDTNDGSRVGVSGTPTLFVNGTKVGGFEAYPQFKAVVDAELAKAEKAAAAAKPAGKNRLRPQPVKAVRSAREG